MIKDLAHDLRYALRGLRNHPVFTAVVVLTLAVAIGATTAIYSAVRTTILDPLPVRDADRLMAIEGFNPKLGRSNAGLGPPVIAELRRHTHVFSELAVCDGMLAKHRGGEFIEMVKGLEVSPGFFKLWQVRPLLGRVFSADEARGGAGKVVVLSHAFWRSHLGGDPGIVGRQIELDAGWINAPYEHYTVVGVMPPHFVFPRENDLYRVPKGDPDGDSRYMRNYGVFVRLADGATAQHARQVLDVIAARALWPGESAVGKRLRAAPGQSMTSPRTLRPGAVLEVVGVVGDARLDDHEAAPAPTLYRPCRDFYQSLHYDRFYLRTAGDPTTLIRPIHAAITQSDPGATHRTVQDVAQELYRSTQGRRFFTRYVTLYAAVGLTLAGVGVYGLVAHTAHRRVREFGIRLALGATRARVSMLAMKDAVTVVAAGLVLGLAGALAGARLLQGQLYGVTPRDPATLAAVSLVLLGATLVACALPAYRAARVDPMEALRHE